MKVIEEGYLIKRNWWDGDIHYCCPNAGGLYKTKQNADKIAYRMNNYGRDTSATVVRARIEVEE